MIPTWKRPLDISLVLLFLPLWLPLLLACSLWIHLVSRGGAFFRQERVGLGGQKFTLLKFRTMVPGADPKIHEQHVGRLIGSDLPMTKLDMVDNRLIPGGGFLRASGLDELPQVLNVLRGDMSLVGPRPCTPSELAHYRPSCHKRFRGLPGITGSWQVNGKNRTTFRRMVALDILYLRRASVVADLKVMTMTLPALYGQVRELMTSRTAAPAGRRLPVRRQPAPVRSTSHVLGVARTLSSPRGTAARVSSTPGPRFRLRSQRQ